MTTLMIALAVTMWAYLVFRPTDLLSWACVIQFMIFAINPCIINGVCLMINLAFYNYQPDENKEPK